jgi:hypothetical protein
MRNLAGMLAEQRCLYSGLQEHPQKKFHNREDVAASVKYSNRLL